jgi:hypothetical protein
MKKLLLESKSYPHRSLTCSPHYIMQETPRMMDKIQPVAVAAIANLIMAAPSFAEAG